MSDDMWTLLFLLFVIWTSAVVSSLASQIGKLKKRVKLLEVSKR